MIKVYNQSMQLVAMLDNAFAIGYEMPLNALWTASFSLPANDPKTAECQPLYFVEMFDGDERIDLFRIVPHAAKRDSSGQTITYQCEHVLATLLDDIMFQFHQLGNLGVYTDDVIAYVLDRQTVGRWQLGDVDFARQFEYSWENENLLAALFSIPKPFVDAYQWTWDTSSYPWTLNLLEPPAAGADPNLQYIRYGVNLQQIEKTVDPTTLCTRLYCLGFGEGVNQLTIAEVNGGLPYLDADTQAQYGVISKIFVDRRFESPETLKARGEALLTELKQPRITYRAKAADLGLQRIVTGSNAIVKDEELGVDIVARIVNVGKRDVTGSPGDIDIEIANRPIDIAGSIADLANRQRINEVYAQGATNLQSHDFADNCDPDHPAVMRFYIPEETARINKMKLSYRCEPFRAYSRAIEGGGAISTTTASGGGTVVSSESDDYEDSPLYETGENKQTIFTDDAGGHFHVVTGGFTDFDGTHYHSIEGVHTHYQTLIPHTHDVFIPSHTHGIVLPNHTHGIDYGIFEGPTPTTVILRVDGSVVPGLSIDEQDIDIIPYLAKDSSGRVTRGAWHEITVTPNGLGRIVATVVQQIFVQSRGGGDF